MDKKEKQVKLQQPATPVSTDQVNLPRAIHLVPMDTVDGFDIRPGFYETTGKQKNLSP